MLNRLTPAVRRGVIAPTPLVLLSALALAAASLAGCEISERSADAFDPTLIEAVPILQQVDGHASTLTEPGVALIRSAEELEALGTDLALGEAAVDFEEQSLVLLALGEQPTGGYWARITAIQLVGGTLWIQGVANAPGEEDVVTQQVTYPYSAVIVPRIDADVEVERDIRSVTGQNPDVFMEARSDAGWN